MVFNGISKDAYALFASGQGSAIGLSAAYIDGIRCTMSSSGTTLSSFGAQIPPNSFATGVPSNASVAVSFDCLVDATFPPASGTTFPLAYVNPSTDSLIYDNWTRT